MYQFDKPTVFDLIEALPDFFLSCKSIQNVPGTPLYAVNCAASDDSKQATASITKLVNLVGSLLQWHQFSFKKLKERVHPIDVGQVLRRLVANCIAKRSQSESVELVWSKQLGVGVKGGADKIIHATEIAMEKLQLSQKA